MAPHFAGWEIYHVAASPLNPDRLYASQTSGWFGQVIQRSDDGGRTWFQPGNEDNAGNDNLPAPGGDSNRFVYGHQRGYRPPADDSSMV